MNSDVSERGGLLSGIESEGQGRHGQNWHKYQLPGEETPRLGISPVLICIFVSDMARVWVAASADPDLVLCHILPWFP